MDTNLNTGPIEQRVCDDNAYSVFNIHVFKHTYYAADMFKRSSTSRL